MFFSFLRSAISESGKTQRIIAAEAGITLAALANYLNGSRSPQFEVAEKLCQACGYTIEFVKNIPSTNVDIKTNTPPSAQLSENEVEILRDMIKLHAPKKRKKVG